MGAACKMQGYIAPLDLPNDDFYSSKCLAKDVYEDSEIPAYIFPPDQVINKNCGMVSPLHTRLIFWKRAREILYHQVLDKMPHNQGQDIENGCVP
jgi:hypothetical protein